MVRTGKRGKGPSSPRRVPVGRRRVIRGGGGGESKALVAQGDCGAENQDFLGGGGGLEAQEGGREHPREAKPILPPCPSTNPSLFPVTRSGLSSVINPPTVASKSIPFFGLISTPKTTLSPILVRRADVALGAEGVNKLSTCGGSSAPRKRERRVRVPIRVDRGVTAGWGTPVRGGS